MRSGRRGQVVRFRRRQWRPWPRPPRLWTRRRLTATAFAAILILFVAPGLDAASLMWRTSQGCKVWMVVDGDTVRLKCPLSGWHTGRILAVDTPEMRSRCLTEKALAVGATYYLRWQLWTARETSVHADGQRDRYGRLLVRMSVDGEGVAGSMVEARLGRYYDGGRRASWCEGRI